MGIFAASDFLVVKKEQCRLDGCLISVGHGVDLNKNKIVTNILCHDFKSFIKMYRILLGFLGVLRNPSGIPEPSGKESTCQSRRRGLYPWIGKIPWRKTWQLTSVFLPEKSHGQRSLACYSPWVQKRSQID